MNFENKTNTQYQLLKDKESPNKKSEKTKIDIESGENSPESGGKNNSNNFAENKVKFSISN
jgi:hypothetical protein